MKETCTYTTGNIDVKKIKNEEKYQIDTEKLFNNSSNLNTYTIKDKKIEFGNNIKYYAIQEVKSQCNNNLEQWHKWFTTTYYYLGNRDGRYNEISENNISYTIPKGCFKECNDNFIINSDYRCEDKKTFKNGKYKNFIAYDPFAIICIIGSFNGLTINEYVYNICTKGNYNNTIFNLLNDNNEILKSNNMTSGYNTIRDAILTDIASVNAANFTNKYHPLYSINNDIKIAYKKIIEYVNYIYKENERDKTKIENNIKGDINKFYTLFDKRDELYMKYLNSFNTNKKILNLSYAHALSTRFNDIKSKICNNNSLDKDIKPVIIYLLEYCIFICFDKKSIYAERLQLYNIHKEDLIGKAIPIYDVKVCDTPSIVTSGQEKPPISIKDGLDSTNYKPVLVKLDNKSIFIFQDYAHILNLYKSFLVVYPVIFIIIISIVVFLIIIYLIDTRYKGSGRRPISWIINYIYATLLWFNYIFKWFTFNILFTFIIKNILSLFYTTVISDTTSEIIKYYLNTYFTPIIIVVLLILLIIFISSISINDIIMFIPFVIIFILESIYILLLILLGLMLNLPKIENLILIGVITYVIYLYYYVIYIFNYTNIEVATGNKIPIIPNYANLLNGAELIATLKNSSDSHNIIYQRNKMINYAFLLNMYKYAYGRLQQI
jgi:hypothetical protein